MIRTIMRDNRVLFGPITDQNLAVISREPVFDGHGIAASANPTQVEVYVTLPHDVNRMRKVQAWFLRNHKILR
jgi:hypothetical protein